MKLLDSLRFRMAALFGRDQIHAEMEEELRSHIEHRADDLERSGMNRAEAERRARIEFGGREKFKEEMPRGARRQFYRRRFCMMCATPAHVAQVSRIHDCRCFDAGPGHRRERRGLCRIEWRCSCAR